MADERSRVRPPLQSSEIRHRGGDDPTAGFYVVASAAPDRAVPAQDGLRGHRVGAIDRRRYDRAAVRTIAELIPIFDVHPHEGIRIRAATIARPPRRPRRALA